MSYASTLVHDITIVRPGTTTDRYGNVTKDWTTATRRTVKGWVSQQGSIGNPATLEDLKGREAQVSNWILYLLPDEDVNGFDRIEWEGITFEAEGPINPAWSPRLKRRHHIEIQLKVVEG